MTDNVEVLFNSGFNKPVTNLKITDKEQIIRSVALHCVIFSSLAELSQFRDGMCKVKGMKEALAVHSDLLELFYCNKPIPLTASMFIKLIIVPLTYSY